MIEERPPRRCANDLDDYLELLAEFEDEVVLLALGCSADHIERTINALNAEFCFAPIYVESSELMKELEVKPCVLPAFCLFRPFVDAPVACKADPDTLTLKVSSGCEPKLCSDCIF
jgi:hypothetical protein